MTHRASSQQFKVDARIQQTTANVLNAFLMVSSDDHELHTGKRAGGHQRHDQRHELQRRHGGEIQRRECLELHRDVGDGDSGDRSGGGDDRPAERDDARRDGDERDELRGDGCSHRQQVERPARCRHWHRDLQSRRDQLRAELLRVLQPEHRCHPDSDAGHSRHLQRLDRMRFGLGHDLHRDHEQGENCRREFPSLASSVATPHRASPRWARPLRVSLTSVVRNSSFGGEENVDESR